MFRELEYQTQVFDRLSRYLDHLAAKKADADRLAELIKEKDLDLTAHSDFAQEAWGELKKARLLPASRADIPFSPRKDGTGEPVPNITLKVPTGGGKTWLAVKSSSMILNKYLGRNAGFILWVVPNEAIYTQTLKNFKNRDHPYRQALDLAAAGRVKIMEKTERLLARDVDSHLCVMVLMLQAANRQTKETLKMFQDRGDVHGFTPSEADQQAQKKMVEDIPNLDCYGGDLHRQIKDSLGNALRIIRPVVVMDEGHKAISDLAFKTIYGFNPSFVLELTATPKDVQPRGGSKPRAGRYSNLLVEITGLALDAEGMIKMPLTLDPRRSADWHAVLNAAVEKLEALQRKATSYYAETSRHIRPILLVQVERTGKDQRDGDHIHAEDAKDWLLKTGFDDAEIAIKTAERNDLKQPENQDLLSPANRIRVIITKEALQEGWDCPFAYILCSLATRGNLNAMTQLVGRILRQPHAEKTGVEALDQCYVFTHLTETHALVQKIKSGLEGEGLGDLVLQVQSESTEPSTTQAHKIYRREQFKQLGIFLPKVLARRDENLHPLDYETDILTRTDWNQFDPQPIAKHIHKAYRPATRQMRKIFLSPDPDKVVEDVHTETLPELNHFDGELAARRISDIVLNPFIGRSIVTKVINILRAKGLNETDLGMQSAHIVEVLREELQKQQDSQAEAYFKQAVRDGLIQFRLRADRNNWNMPDWVTTHQPPLAPQLLDDAGNLVQRSLFERVYCDEMNNDERNIAIYLDEQTTLSWWHRNVAKQHYGLQGWKKGVFYPDFIFSLPAKTSKKEGAKKLVVLEMKGEHLSGNADTAYKKEVLHYLTEKFCLDNTKPMGKLELKSENIEVVCDLVLFDGWKSEIGEKYFND